MKDINKYIFEDYNDSDEIASEYIQENIKNDRQFNKFIKICMKYKIYLFYKIGEKYELRTNKQLIYLINKKKSELTLEFGKMILKLHNFDKYLETSTSDNFSEIYDTKNKIDQLYEEYNKNYRYLDQLIKMLNDIFTDDILLNYVTKEYTLQNKNNGNIIDEYSN
jgi:hypothetical protein